MIKEKDLPEGWIIMPFTKCIEKEASSNKLKIPQNNFLDEGKYAIVDQGVKFIAGYTNDPEKVYTGDLPVVIFGDHTRIFKYVEFPFALGADGTKILVPNRGLFDPKYFYFFLTGLRIESHGYSRHYKFLKEKQIVIPPLPIQKKIVAVLEKAEKLKEWRKGADKLSDDFLKSTFLEMFGDPGKNPKKLETIEIKELVLKTENENPAKDYPNAKFKYVDISSIDAKKGKIVYVSEILGKNAPSRAKQKVNCKDLLISTVRPNLNAVALVPEELNNQICSTGFCILRANTTKVTPEYLFYISRSNYFINSLVQKCKGANYPAVSDRDITPLVIPLPHIELQNKFAEIVEQVEQLRESQKQSKQHIDNLFNALMQKAFRGELA